MLKKLFGSKKVPQNEGEKANPSAPVKGFMVMKVFELELSNMEGSPSYTLTHQLTVGSEIGNIVISDPSISPRHATFLLQQEVISLVDHGSVSGTHVNGKRIPSGRYIILEESDVITIGDMEIRILARNESVSPDELPEVPETDEEVVEDEVIEEDDEEIEEDVEELDEDNEVIEANSQVTIKKDKHAANALIRVVAVFCDLLISYGILIILLPFDEVRAFLNDIPSLISGALGLDQTTLMNEVSTQLGFVFEILGEMYEFVFSSLPLVPIVFIFFVLRFLSTLVLGVSLAEFLLFIRPQGTFLWARLGGTLRVTLGMLTAPLLIFDLPAVLSRRTFKEVATWTRIDVSSRLLSFISTMVMLPLVIVFVLVAPLFQGLEMVTPVIVNDQIEQRIKVAAPEEVGEAPVTKLTGSEHLNFKITYEPQEVSLFPDFKFLGIQNKLNLMPGVSFYHHELKRSLRLEVMKNFDLKQLLAYGMRGNFFLYTKFPEIYSFVYEASANTAIKTNIDTKNHSKFAMEFMSFSKLAMEVNPENAVEVMESYTPLLKGLIDFKDSLLSLVEYKDFSNIGFIKIGNVIFMKFSYNQKKPFDLIIPLIRGQGRIYKVSFDSSEELEVLSNNFYKFTLDNTNWLETTTQEELVPGSLQVVDYFSGLAQSKTISSERAQGIYAYYFETTVKVLERGDLAEFDLWKKSVKSAFQVIEKFKPTANEIEEENPLDKLHQNFRDLQDSLENKNFEYFGILDTANV